MNKLPHRIIEVYAHWAGMSRPTLLGFLHTSIGRGKEIFSFEYNSNWLKNHINMLDPSLLLYQGIQYAPPHLNNFGIFLDSSPDRWGKLLMDRRENLLAREAGTKPRKLLESDYLLGVYDQNRIGALRFKINSKDTFLDDDQKLAAPPWASLKKLEHASRELEKVNVENNPNYSKWLKMLIAPGGSLGGARPKASVIDENNELWIAKFPSASDEIDVGAWEMLAYKLAMKASINMSEARLEKYNYKNRTFINKRFDRTKNGERIHYASAMTMLQRKDGAEASYLEIAKFIRQYGSHPEADLEQLWRRIVFNVCISNVDDHLRNHGFLLDAHGWKLSPAFDINPNADKEGLELNISENDNSQDLTLVKEVAEYFRIKSDKADQIITQIVRVVEKWRKEAIALGISTEEQNRMQNAFRLVE